MCRLSAFAAIATLIFGLISAAQAQIAFAPGGSLGAVALGHGIGRGLGQAMSSVQGLATAKGNLSDEIATARSRFWTRYPDGADREAAESEFAQLLFAKDFFFLSISLPQGPYSAVAKLATQLGGQVDGGIPDGPRPLFYEWVIGVREFLGARNHFSDDSFGRNVQPDLLVVLPNQLLAAFDDPEVQKLYDAYKFARDRAEFIAAGRLGEFEAANTAARAKIAVGEPKQVPTTSGYLQFDYGQVPEDFVPEISHSVGGRTFSVSYQMDKQNIGSLAKVSLDRFGVLDLYSPYDMFSNEADLYGEDAGIAANENAVLLKCSYITEGNQFDSDLFWYQVAPSVADSARLSARLSDHPMLNVGPAAGGCPARQGGAPQPVVPGRPAFVASEPSAEPKVAALDPQELAIKNGERAFRKCMICHSLEADGGGQTGPNLHGIFGSAAGSQQGFEYSDEFLDSVSGIVWSEDTLQAAFEHPNQHKWGQFGSVTRVHTLPNQNRRTNIIAYLKSLSAN